MRQITLFLCQILFFLAPLMSSSLQIVSSEDKKQLKIELLESIASAQERILLMTFTLSDPQIIQALNQKANAGLEVSIIINKDHQQPILMAKVPSIQVFTRTEGEGRVHHKILVADDQVWIGSANFTESAFLHQQNLMIGLNSPEIAEKIYQEANAFRFRQPRKLEPQHPFFIGEYLVHLGLLPYEGYPAKPIESAINKESKKLLLNLIASASRTIQIAMMVWTDPELTQAVKKAHQRGVAVEIITSAYDSYPLELALSGIPVRIYTSSLMHNKFIYVDQSALANGSANWSKSSFSRNDESFIVIEGLSEEHIQSLNAYWHYLKTH
ncbi:MAG: hypothetical protein K0S07_181 [Chlamydiales bacterium]|jgi:phosphatidylserine/phosphatidylglycerophosphate/cardiolipin synthase-like enzyme|nr:hypothetical protein [Chlamydiales bacterium]